MLINDLFHQVGMVLKEISDSTEYLLDSFPVPICDNIRIFNVKIIQSAQYKGYIASKKRYFYFLLSSVINNQKWYSRRICVYAW